MMSQSSILSPLKKQEISIYDCRSDAALCLIVVDKTSYPADRTPRGIPAAAGFPLQLVGAELTAKAQSLKEERVIEKRYRPAAWTVSHVSLLKFEDGCF